MTLTYEDSLLPVVDYVYAMFFSNVDCHGKIINMRIPVLKGDKKDEYKFTDDRVKNHAFFIINQEGVIVSTHIFGNGISLPDSLFNPIRESAITYNNYSVRFLSKTLDTTIPVNSMKASGTLLNEIVRINPTISDMLHYLKNKMSVAKLNIEETNYDVKF